MPDSAPLDRTLAALSRAPLRDALVLGLRHERGAAVPFYRPFLLMGFWLDFDDGLVWFDNDQGVLTASPTARPEIPAHLADDGLEDLCVLSGDGFTLDPARDPAPVAALELVAEDDAALRAGNVLAVFLRCTNGAELFAHAWSLEGVSFGRAAEYAAWLEEQARGTSWRRWRWDAAGAPWTWDSRAALALHP